MNLNTAACEYLRLDIAADPPVTASSWELSVDGGTTWKTARTVDGLPAWLIAGPTYSGTGGPDFTVTHPRTPILLRLVDNPETVLRAPSDVAIYLS